MVYLWRCRLRSHNVGPVEKTHRQEKEDNLAKLESYIELQMIPDDFLFVDKVASLVLCFGLACLLFSRGTALCVSFDVATREDRGLGRSHPNHF